MTEQQQLMRLSRNNNIHIIHMEAKSGTDLSTKKGKSLERSSPMVYVIFGSLLFDLLAFTIILPLFPSLLDYFSKNDSSGFYQMLTQKILWFRELVGAPERFTSVLFGGFLGSMFSFMQFVASPIMGGLSDCYGRKPVLLLSSVGIALSYLLWAYSRNFAVFVFARFLGGISKGNISLSMSVITDVSSERSRGRGMALIGVAFSLGFILGPMMGAYFAIFNKTTSGPWFMTPALLAFALATVEILLIAFMLKETLPKEKRIKEVSSAMSYAIQLLNISSLFRFKAIKNVPTKHLSVLQRIGLINFLYLFLYSGLEFTITFLVYHKFRYSSVDQATIFVTTGIIMTILQGTVVRRIPEASTKRYAVFSLYLIVPAYILVAFAEGSGMLYAGMIIYAISTAFVVTCLTTLVSTYGNENQKGTVLGIFRSLGALGRALGPVVGSVAFWCIGSKLTYLIGGLLLLLPAFLLQRTRLSPYLKTYE